MARVKRGVTAKARHKKVLKAAKGYYGSASRTYRVAKQAVTKAGQYAYRDRRARKRDFRRLWIVRINAEAHNNGLSYSRMMDGLHKAEVIVDRKVLAELAVNNKPAFAELVNTADRLQCNCGRVYLMSDRWNCHTILPVDGYLMMMQ